MPNTSPPAPPIDYDAIRASFQWADVRRQLDGLPGGGLNIAHEAVDRHVLAGRGSQTAIRWLPRRGQPIDLTYAELAERTDRFANVLDGLGCRPGTRVATLAGRVPELYVTALGTFKAGGVYTPLFSAFGPEPIRQRMTLGSIEVLVTTPRLFARKVAPILDELPTLRHVLVTGQIDLTDADPRVSGFDALMAEADSAWSIPDTDAETPALLHFTSGTTGTPKGVVHVHQAVVNHHASGSFALDLRPGDVFWCTADPGWVTGTSYGIISPLTHGVTNIVDEADFDAERWLSIVEQQRVDVWYTAPTALRMLMKVGVDARDRDMSSLRLIASVGEPLNPEAVRWAQDTFEVPILDNWWQTETGGIMIANYRTEPVRPGSMGRPLPGIEATILERHPNGELVLGADGRPVEITDPTQSGELALRAGWPSMFRTYLDQPDRYAACFVDGWYRTGDLAKRDGDGYYWFVGRGDDVIKSAGHLIGPFEVESALVEHPAVAEAGVIGLPHETMGEIVKAFVTLAAGFEEGPELHTELVAHARGRLGSAVAPREIAVVDHLPHTRSGKIMRRLLKARELGLDEGDISTLASPPTGEPEDGEEGER